MLQGGGAASTTITYTYDPLDRLTGVMGTHPQTYAYDTVGNLVNKNGLTMDYSTAASLPHAPGSAEQANLQISFSYENGNRSSRQIFYDSQLDSDVDYAYDDENRLTELAIERYEGGQPIISQTTYAYDASGALAKRIGEGGATEYIGDLYEVQWVWEEIVEMGTPASGVDAAVDAAGRIHVVWLQDSGQSLYYARWDSAGWTEPQDILTDTVDPMTACAIAVSGNVVEVVFNWRNVDEGSVLDRIFYARSTDGGQSWDTPSNWFDYDYRVSTSHDYIYKHNRGVDLAVDGNGVFHVVYGELPDSLHPDACHANAYWLYHRASADGTGWLDNDADVAADIWDELGNCADNDSFSLAAMGTGVHLAWSTYDPTFSVADERIRYSAYNGSAWSGPEIVAGPDGTSRGNPTIFADGAGDVHVAWLEDFEVLYRERSVGVWGGVQQLSDGSGGAGRPDVTPYAGVLCVLWPEGSRLVYRLGEGGSWQTPQVFGGGLTAIRGVPLEDDQGKLRAVVAASIAGSARGGVYDLDLLNNPRTVSHYYALGGRAAMRVRDRVDGVYTSAVYYIHGDHVGSTVMLTDQAGAAVGRAFYDAYGGALENTIPLTLTDRLYEGRLFDAATGLVYHRAGRYYDPQIGLRLQPSPAGGPPTLPQALNRYAVPPVQSVVGQAAPHLHPLLVTAGKGAAKTAITARFANPARGALIGLLTAPRPGETLLTLIMSRWARYQYFASGAASPFEWGSVAMPAWGRSFRAYTVKGLVTEVEPGLFLTESGELVETGVLPKSAAILTAEAEIRAALSGTPAFLLKHGIGLGWAVGLNFLVQYWGDVGNPYLTPEQRTGRLISAGFGGGAVGYVITAIVTAKLGAALGIGGGPPGMALGAALGFTYGFIYYGFVQPQIIIPVFGLGPERNLAPLQP